MAVVTASQLQARGSLLFRALGALLLLFLGLRLVQHLKIAGGLGAKCAVLQLADLPHVTVHAGPASVTGEPASEGDEGTLECEDGYAIDGFQPLHIAAMVCADDGKWRCSDSADVTADEPPSWACAARQCVEVSAQARAPPNIIPKFLPHQHNTKDVSS